MRAGLLGKHSYLKWYDKMQISEIILLESDLETRANMIYFDYVKKPGNSKPKMIELHSYYLQALSKIRKRLEIIITRQLGIF